MRGKHWRKPTKWKIKNVLFSERYENLLLMCYNTQVVLSGHSPEKINSF